MVVAALVLPLKAAVRCDLFTSLSNWLDSDVEVSFQPQNPLEFILPKPDFSAAACRDELLRIHALRLALSDVLLKADSHKAALEENVLDDLYEYHAVLLEFEKRGFPTVESPDLASSPHAMSLIWKAAFVPGRQEEHGTLVWDRACVVYTIVALLTQRIDDASVTDRDECKLAVSRCQFAAGLLSYLQELVSTQDYATVDLCKPMLSYWEQFLIAQAQNFIYRMASSGTANTNHGTLSLLAQSASLLFNQALVASQDPRLVSEVPRQQQSWGTYCKAQSMLLASKAEYHQSVVHRLNHQWGSELGRLKVCLNKLQGTKDFLAAANDEDCIHFIKRECSIILPVVQDRHVEADRDNHNIYQDEIPVLATLKELPAKQLAKRGEGLQQNMLVPKKALFVNL